jgi:hypothetical protein
VPTVYVGLCLLFMISYPSICMVDYWQCVFSVDIDGIWYLQSTKMKVVRTGFLMVGSSDTAPWFVSSAIPIEKRFVVISLQNLRNYRWPTTASRRLVPSLPQARGNIWGSQLGIGLIIWETWSLVYSFKNPFS